MMIADIHDLMSARYEEGGRGPDAYDCFGLFAELCRRRGMPVPDHPTAADINTRNAAIDAASKQEYLALDAPEPGAVVLIRLGPLLHIGMVLDGGRFIHANHKTGVTVARLDDLQWRERITGFYRYRGRDD